ncbi:MAG: 50S ribosomal protein L28 [Chloroflexota bacterium]|nr:50S ribosomal protein L28 [Anaerolineae bacterium]
MSGKCDICGKGRQFGHNVSHSKQRTKRSWKPNLQNATVQDGDEVRRLRVCTRCLRTLQKHE